MGQSLHDLSANRKANEVNHRLIPALGEPRKPEPVEESVMVHCGSMLDAIRLAVHMSNYPHDFVCSELGINNGHWTRIMQGKAHFPPNKIVPLIEITGCLAPLQYLMARFGYRLPEESKLKRVEAA